MGHGGEQHEHYTQVEAVATSISIVNILRDGRGATIREIARQLDVSASTAHSHISTLIENDLVVQTEEGYRPSLRFLEVGSEVRENHIEIYTAGRRPAEKLAEETEELVWLMTEENGRGYYVCKEAGKNAVESGRYIVGTGWPLHCSAGGKVILSHMSKSRMNAVLDTHGMPSITKNTITDRSVLIDDLQRIRERGFGLNREEDELGIHGVAAPVKTDDETLIGTVSVAGPVSRMDGARFEEEIPELLVEAANVIEINARGLSR